MSSDQHDPDALRVHFGMELRRTRTRADLSQGQLATALGCTPQWICQLEKATKPVSPQTALDLDTYFKTEGWEREDGHFNRIYKTIRRAGRNRVLHASFDSFRMQERRAISVRAVAAQLVPGLLQLEGYAAGVMDQNEPAEIVDARVAGRMERQQIFNREHPPQAIFVLDESVLRRPIGGPKIMADQIDHLVSMARRPNVQILVMPFDRVTPTALAGSSILLSFSKEPDLLYVESGTVSFLTDSRDETFKMGIHFITTVSEALSQNESIEFMSRAREEYL
ncbi:helix-turn-helix transcriptional regulator [Actinomadura meridiana]|uniref:Helix-turn-helix transcriptional regulator n=1 Tax=Actinomadura meridiana TaxID=559626 RepID=A0ABP8CMK2_9ACTN